MVAAFDGSFGEVALVGVVGGVVWYQGIFRLRFERGDAAHARLHLANDVARGKGGEVFEPSCMLLTDVLLGPLFLGWFQFVFHGRSLSLDILRRNSFLGNSLKFYG